MPMRGRNYRHTSTTCTTCQRGYKLKLLLPVKNIRAHDMQLIFRLTIGRVTISCLFLRFVLIFDVSVLENKNVLISKQCAYV